MVDSDCPLNINVQMASDRRLAATSPDNEAVSEISKEIRSHIGCGTLGFFKQ